MSYGERLSQAMDARKVDRKTLAAQLGISVAAVGQVLNGSTKMFDAVNHTKACLFLAISPLWLADGRGLMDAESSQSRVGIPLERFEKTLDVRTVVPKRTREQLMAGELGEEFEWALEDDALAPEYVRGTALVWSPSKTPAVGSVLLLQDQDKQLHVRLMAQGKGTRLARAPNPNYATFDLEADGLSILAVAKWQPMP